MLARTGLKAALAAEMVSLWICIRVPFFDFRSATTGTGEPESMGGGAVVDVAGEGFEVEPSEVMRSMSVVPEDSWKMKRPIKPGFPLYQATSKLETANSNFGSRFLSEEKGKKI